MLWTDDADEVVVREPILEKKDCQVRIDFVEPTIWTVKEEKTPGHGGEAYKAMKMTLTITDPNVQTEHEGARPRLVFEHQMNLDKYPYLSKKTGDIAWLGRGQLHDLEEAFGFDPVFVDTTGQPVDAYLTRTGHKVAPKGEGIKRK